MKIAVGAKGGTPESEVCQAVDNASALSAAHGAGIQSAETVCKLGADIAISGHVGPKAFTVLAAGGIPG